MIYLFLGENYFRKQLIQKWKDIFQQKYTQLNIFHIRNCFDYDMNFYSQNLLGNGMFSEKILFIVDDFNPGNSYEEDEEKLGKTLGEEYQEFFFEIFPKIDQNTTLVFNNVTLDKRGKWYKRLLEVAEIKDFSITDETQLIQKIQQLYGDTITQIAIQKIIELKGINFSLIHSELEKLFLLNEVVDIEQVQHLSQDIEESFFDIINLILNKNFSLAIKKLNQISHFVKNPYILYNMLVGNLRIYFYIFLLKKSNISSKEIKNILDLGKRAFLVDKNFSLSFQDFFSLYDSLLSIDSKMKQGKLIGSEMSDMLFEIEKIFLFIQKK